MQAEAEVFEVPLELVPDRKTAHIVNVGIQFSQEHVSGQYYRFIPELLYVNNSLTGHKYSLKEAKQFLTLGHIKEAVKSLGFLAEFDEDMDDDMRCFLKTVCKGIPS